MHLFLFLSFLRVGFEFGGKRISRNKNTLCHAADRNAFLRRVGLAWYTSSRISASRENSRRLYRARPSSILIRPVALSLSHSQFGTPRRAAARPLSSSFPLCGKRFFWPSLFFSHVMRKGEPNCARYRSGAASSTSGCHGDVPSVEREGWQERKTRLGEDAGEGGEGWSESWRAKRA